MQIIGIGMNNKWLPVAVRLTLFTVSFLLLVSLVVYAQEKAAEGVPNPELSAYWQGLSGFPAGMMEAQQTQLPTTIAELLAKAAPDECFNGIGQPYPAGPPCATGIPKVNQAYIWGMTRSGPAVWFGTMSNTQCLVFSLFLGMTAPHQNSAWVCEYGESQSSPPLPATIGDFRRPRIYSYNTVTKAFADQTPADPRLNTTVGLRAAGNLNNVVLLSGPALPNGINFFAFRAESGEYLGSANLPAFNNIRRMLVFENVLYATVGNTVGEGGSVLRWTGNEASPFTFDVVGSLESSSWEMAAHEGRLFVTTWPAQVGTKMAALYMSPPVPGGGLTTAHAGAWTRIWKADDYEPDPVTAATYGGGALASFGGYLFWGTMHVPILSTKAHIVTYGLPTGDTGFLLQTFLGSERAISIFRGSGFNTTPSFELVYGLPVLPVMTAPGSWSILPNKMGKLPQWGPSGFGNPFNNYTWTMEVFDGRLFVGTMDYSYLFPFMSNMLLGTSITLPSGLFSSVFGADLFYFPSAASPAFPESISGIGNYTNYGIRTMTLGTQSLFIGTANPMNLMTNPLDSLPEGGWELIELTKRPPNTPVGNNVRVSLENGITVTYCQVTQSGVTAGTSLANPFETDPIPPPDGYVKPSVYFTIGSSANWRQQTCGTKQASVCVPDSASYEHLFQLQFNRSTGRFEWVDITERQTNNSVCGSINSNFIGILAVMRPINIVPTLSQWGLILLFIALLSAGWMCLRRTAPKAAA
jgi:hypothetical protein